MAPLKHVSLGCFHGDFVAAKDDEDDDDEEEERCFVLKQI